MSTQGIQHRIVISCIIKEYRDDTGNVKENPYVNPALSKQVHDKFSAYFQSLPAPSGFRVVNHSIFLLNPSLAEFLDTLAAFMDMRNSVMTILFSGDGSMSTNFDIKDYDGSQPTPGDTYNEGMRFSGTDILWDFDFNNMLATFKAENDIYFIPDCCYADGLTIREKMRRDDWLKVEAQAFCLLPDNYSNESATYPYVLDAFNNLFPLVENNTVLYKPDMLHKYLNLYLEKDGRKVKLKHYNPRAKYSYPLFSVNNICKP